MQFDDLTNSRNCGIISLENEKEVIEMTNEQFFKEYENFLTNFGCVADEFGNRPCDYGRPCDKCLQKDFQENWKKHLTNLLESGIIKTVNKERKR